MRGLHAPRAATEPGVRYESTHGPASTDMTEDGTALCEELARAYRVFGALGWGDLGDGHISARDPERTDCFWMLGYGVTFPEATADDMVLVDQDGQVVAGTGPVNRPGYHIHQPILAARRDIMSVAHTHTSWGTPFSAQARMLEPITQEACIFFEDCALFDDEEVQVQGLAAGSRIARSMGRNNALILRSHGLLTAGASVASAVARFVLMERAAEAQLKSPDSQPISADGARFAKADLVGEEYLRTTFNFLARQHGVY